ncbi:MFS transporter [Rhodopila sp.]|uniref:MFS transporter n=1 Tax=Rhodopila sp. TaxID=2480087 RepID=UPI003D0A281D
MAGVGTVLFLPQILKAIGVTNTQAGLLTAIPYLFGAIAIVSCGHLSDRIADRYWTLVVTCGLATIGMLLAAMLPDSLWVLAAFSLATSGFYGMKSPFWPLASTFLTGTALASTSSNVIDDVTNSSCPLSAARNNGVISGSQSGVPSMKYMKIAVSTPMRPDPRSSINPMKCVRSRHALRRQHPANAPRPRRSMMDKAGGSSAAPRRLMTSCASDRR